MPPADRASRKIAHIAAAKGGTMESIVKDYKPGASPLVLACSPRKGGNSDLAARLIAEGLEAAGASPGLVFLRERDIMPCRGCQHCGEAPDFSCVLMKRDQAEDLFRLVLTAPALFFASPIYFYHVPAAFKGFIDRAQRYYVARNSGDPVLNSLSGRPAHVVLVAGRSRGEKLFEGTMLTMKYFLWPFGARVAGDLRLHGIDGPDDLRSDGKARDAVREFAAKAWEKAKA